MFIFICLMLRLGCSGDKRRRDMNNRDENARVIQRRRHIDIRVFKFVYMMLGLRCNGGE